MTDALPDRRLVRGVHPLVLAGAVLVGCPRAPTEAPVFDPPKQTVLGGEQQLGMRMQDMIAEADAVIARISAAPGPPERRWAEGVVALRFALRPEFGPANAALPREQKLAELGAALGLDPIDAPPVVGPDFDDFVRDVRELTERLRVDLDVEGAAVSTGALGWSPEVWGWKLVIRDPSRTVEEVVPYGEGEGAVNPRITLFLFERARLSASRSLVAREQPAAVEGAGATWVALSLQAAQSGDQDPGGVLRDAVLARLFPGQPLDLPAAAAAAGATRATLRSGVLVLYGPPAFDLAEDPPPEVTLDAPGAHVALWVTRTDALESLTLLPLGR